MGNAIHAGALSISNAFKLVSILLVTIFLGRSSGAADVGTYSLLLATAAVLQSVAIGGLSGAAIHRLLKTEQFGEALQAIAATRVVLILPTFLLLPIPAFIVLFHQDVSPAAYILFFVFSAMGTFDLPELAHISQGRFGRVAYSRIVVVVALILPKIVVASYGNLDVLLILQGAETMAWQLALLHRSGLTMSAFREALGKLRQGALDAWLLRRLWLSSIVSSLSQRGDLFIVAALLGSGAAGQYSTASRPVEAAVIIVTGVVTVIFNRLIVRSAEVSDYVSESRRSSRLILLLGMAVTLGLVMLGPILIDFLYGPAFLEASQLIAIYSVSLIFTYQRQFLSKVLIIEKAYGYSLYSNVSFLVVNVAANFSLIPSFGLMGAAIAAVISHPLSLALSFLTTQKGRDLLVVSVGVVILPQRIVLPAASRLIAARELEKE